MFEHRRGGSRGWKEKRTDVRAAETADTCHEAAKHEGQVVAHGNAVLMVNNENYYSFRS